MLIRNDHLFLTSCQEVAEISKPLKQLGIHYFSYDQIYKNGERVYLTSSAEIVSNYFEKKHYLTCGNESNPEYYKEQIVLWSTFSNKHYYNENAELGAAHGVYLFLPKNDFCEVYGFATSKNNEHIVNTYFNKMYVLKEFTKYFKEKAQSLLVNAERNKMFLPFNDSYKEIINQESKSLDDLLFSKKEKVKLSKRQRECADLILQGKSSTSIAKHLNLSIRTIEHYLDHLKLKFSCHNKHELILKLISEQSFFN